MNDGLDNELDNKKSESEVLEELAQKLKELEEERDRQEAV